MYLELTRGDAEDVEITDITDENGDPYLLAANDVLIWSAKHHYPDTNTLLTKTSVDGGISLDVGMSSATIGIVPDDWTFQLGADMPFVWDLQLLRGGVPATAKTVASGDGLIKVDVADNPVIGPASLGAPGGVTCTPWATVDDVLEPCAEEADPYELALCLQIASDILYELTGHKWRGVCTDEVRPLARWRAAPRFGWWPAHAGVPYRWGWCSCNRTEEYGCSSVPQITLPGHPVDPANIEVTIDGAAFTDFVLVDRRKLVRTDGDGWPCCQDITLPTTETGTWAVRYGWGVAPPPGGRRSAALLACQILTAMNPDGDCQLPDNVTNLVRQGVSVSLDPAGLFTDGHTGIRVVDLWIDSILKGDMARSALIVPGQSRRVARTR